MRLHPGEVEAGGWRVAGLPEVVRLLRDAATAPPGRPQVVAVDGRGGAGTSTLVDRLRELVPRSAVVHTDDVAWHHAAFDWGGPLVEHVLRPVHRGRPVAHRPAAWVQRGRPGVIAVPGGLDVLWVEGTGVVREELAPWLDASVWVQGDLDEQERRLVARDGDSPEQQRHVAAWLAEELPFLLRERPWDRATLVLDGTSPLPHDPQTQAVLADPAARPRRTSGRGPA